MPLFPPLLPNLAELQAERLHSAHSEQQWVKAISEGSLKVSQEEFTSEHGRDRANMAWSSGGVKGLTRLGQVGQRTGGQARGHSTHSGLGAPQLARRLSGFDASGLSMSAVQQGSGPAGVCELGTWILG